jgi:hypothetical protein
MASTKNFTIEGRAGSIIKDIQRDWMWEVSIPEISNILSDTAIAKLGSGGFQEELTCRAKSIAVPSRGVNMIESNFGGMKQWFPGKPTLDYTVTINFVESENGNIHSILTEWNQKIFNLKSGHSQMAGGKRGPAGTSYVVPNMYLTMKNYAGEAREKMIIFKNVMLQNVGAAELSYDSDATINFSATFQFDLWFLGKANDTWIEL